MLFAVTVISAYEIPDENEELARTCRINVKVQVIPDTEMEMATGRAIVTAILTDDAGNPYRQEKVRLAANAGTFICNLPEAASDTTAQPVDCFQTGFDGSAKLYLVNIPLNTPIRITAAYDCDDRTVSSFATMSISRSVAKKKGSGRVVPKNMK